MSKVSTKVKEVQASEFDMFLDKAEKSKVNTERVSKRVKSATIVLEDWDDLEEKALINGVTYDPSDGWKAAKQAFKEKGVLVAKSPDWKERSRNYNSESL